MRLLTRWSTVLSFLALSLLPTTGLSAWTGPAQPPPNGNVTAPLNIGTASQVKNGAISVNALAVYGNALLSGTTNYLNFGTTAGATGYGIRNNNGTLEFKNNGGPWASMASWAGVGGTGTAGRVPRFSGATTLTDSVISDTGTNVGIGDTSPSYKLDVSGDARATGILRTDDKLITSRYGTAGTYSSAQVQGIWSIGDAYQIDVTNDTFGNLYGIGYAYNQNGGSPFANQHQIVFTNGGTIQAAIGLTSGTGYFAGSVGIGDTSPSYKLDVAGTVAATAFVYSSDSRLKRDLEPLKDAARILSVAPQSFVWRATGERDTGVIAQDVERVFPEFVHTGPDGLKTVDYPKLVVPLIEVVRAQDARIKALEERLERAGL